MRVEPNETPDDIIEKSVKAIETIENQGLREDSLAAMSMMSEDKYSSELIQKYIRREMLMNSTLYKEWISEDIEEVGKDRDKKRIIDALELKFDFISKDTRKYIKSIDDQNIIDKLFDKAIETKSIEELLDKVKSLN